MAGKKDAKDNKSKDKPRLSLIPKQALWAMGNAFTYGEEYYGAHNWRDGIPISFLLDAALRHINEFANGEDIDVKSQNHHLGNAMANLAMAIEMTSLDASMDDRHKPTDEVIVASKKIMKKHKETFEKLAKTDTAIPEFIIPDGVDIVSTNQSGDYVRTKDRIIPLKQALDEGIITRVAK